MKKIKNKKILFFIGFLLLLGVVGVTFAFSYVEDVFQSVFHTEPYQIVTVEQFESPDGWIPGQTVPKEVAVTNKSSMDVAIRVSFLESWVSADNQNLPLTDDGNEPVVYFNYAEDLTNWVKIGNYYYYTKALAPDETTTTLLKSVTFNPDANITSMSCTTVDGIENCITTLGDYTGATYTVNVKIETIQYDQYRSGWDYSVSIKPHNSSPRYIYSEAEDYIVLWSPLRDGFVYYENSSSITGYAFVKLAISNNRVVNPIAGFRYNGNEYYIERGFEHRNDYIELLVSVFGENNCYRDGNLIFCSDINAGLDVILDTDGSVEVSSSDFVCHVCINGNYQCYAETNTNY